jgi:CRP-like cAMP-binding protein
MNEGLLVFLNRFITVSPQDVGELMGQMEVRNYDKKVKLTDIGETEQHMYFILNGLARKFFYKGKNEVITHIVKEGGIISSSASFITGTPSKYVVETMEPTSVLVITRQKLEDLFSNGKKWEKIVRILTAHYFIIHELRQLDNIRYSTRERFVKFMNENPDLVRRVPQKHLASFLNIKPETFSRIKHSLLK